MNKWTIAAAAMLAIAPASADNGAQGTQGEPGGVKAEPAKSGQPQGGASSGAIQQAVNAIPEGAAETAAALGIGVGTVLLIGSDSDTSTTHPSTSHHSATTHH